MDAFLWTFDELQRLVNHSQPYVRDWAADRLIELFPDQAGDIVAPLLDDDYQLLNFQIARFLGGTGDTEKYGPLLFEQLKQTEGRYFGVLAEALGDLGYRPALPVMLAYIQQEDRQYAWDEFGNIARALGQLGGEEVHQTLWSLFDHLGSGDHGTVQVASALLAVAQPEDVPRLVERYRAWAAEGYENIYLGPFAEAGRAEGLFDFLNYRWVNRVVIVMGYADDYLGHIPELSNKLIHKLQQAFDDGHQGVFDILLAEARRLFESRGDDLAAWRAAWEAGTPPVGYRRQALMDLLMLEAFAAQANPNEAIREQESQLGLCLFFQLQADQDDQRRLETASDKTEMLLTIVTEDREQVLPDVVEQVVALGPEMAPRLVKWLRTNKVSWGIPRVVEAIVYLAQRYPGSCDEAVSSLIKLLHRDQTDEVSELSSEALVAIGPTAIPEIIANLPNEDYSREIYLTGAIGKMPTERSAQALIDLIDTDDSITDNAIIHYLGEIGSASAIEPLYEVWLSEQEEDEELGPVDRELARSLLILCELHGVEKPELDQWRQIVADEDAQMKKLGTFDFAESDSDEAATAQEVKDSDGNTPQINEAANPKSKKGGKKKGGQRKGGKGKKKRRKK